MTLGHVTKPMTLGHVTKPMTLGHLRDLCIETRSAVVSTTTPNLTSSRARYSPFWRFHKTKQTD